MFNVHLSIYDYKLDVAPRVLMLRSFRNVDRLSIGLQCVINDDQSHLRGKEAEKKLSVIFARDRKSYSGVMRPDWLQQIK